MKNSVEKTLNFTSILWLMTIKWRNKCGFKQLKESLVAANRPIKMIKVSFDQFNQQVSNKPNYYSFKIFPQFWLAKSTRIIHLNQLLMTKFGRSLCLTRKWRQKCSLLQVNAPLTEKTWGRGWVVFVVKTKMAGTSLVLRVRNTAGTRRNNGQKHSKNSEGDSAIWRIFAELDKPKRTISKMNWTSMQVSMF